MKKILIAFLFLTFQSALCSDFGSYNYTKYAQINNQIQYNKMRAIRAQRMRTNPAGNIRYPSGNNRYPNIQASNTPISANKRYSPSYYRNYY